MNLNKSPVIVVVGFNRPNSLKRLLCSIDKAKYPEYPIRLIISLDGGDNDAVTQTAYDFQWRYGEKEIKCYKERLGLKRHIVSCGDLTAQYEAVIILEDDMFVSPYFYYFAIEALKFYSGDDRISGISLYSHSYNETAKLPFYPVKDDSDVFFMQLPSSWGQVWTKQQWNDFKKWLDNGVALTKRDNLPDNVIKWSESSWKKLFFKYLYDTNKYFVYPRSSFCTNFSEKGIHMGEPLNTYQVILQLSKSFDYRFKKLDESLAVYDAYCELLPEILNIFGKKLKNFNYEVDLYGTKDVNKIKRAYILTIRKSKSPIFTYSCQLKPKEMNIICDVNGEDIVLSKKGDVIASKLKIHSKEFEYYYEKKGIKELFIILFHRIFEKVFG